MKESDLAITFERELKSRRQRLGSDPFPILKKALEKELYSQADLEIYYRKYLALPKLPAVSLKPELDRMTAYLLYLEKKLSNSDNETKLSVSHS